MQEFESNRLEQWERKRSSECSSGSCAQVLTVRYLLVWRWASRLLGL